MNKKTVLEYIKKMTKEDIINYALKQRISISNNDINTIYNYVKENSNYVLDSPLDALNNIKDKISKEAYYKLLELYNNYKFIIDKIK